MQRFKRLVPLVIAVLLVFTAWTHRYNIFDWWRLRGYEPPAKIVQLADDTRMTATGRRLFYVNHPELNDKPDFNRNCTISEQSIVLGCYVTNQGIYLFDVSDERLNGVHQVTAAHEMLHAAYDRLSGRERQRINELTAQAFADLDDDRIKKTIELYRARDPSVVPNELHSILATEVESLPAELEAYYAQYFDDRLVVVHFSQAYEAAFQERKDRVAQYDQRLTVLKQNIEAKETELEQRDRALVQERETLDELSDRRQFEEYNARVPGYNTMVRQYNTLVNDIRQLIDDYNQLVIERNSVALEENELIKAIDSRPSTLPTQ